MTPSGQRHLQWVGSMEFGEGLAWGANLESQLALSCGPLLPPGPGPSWPQRPCPHLAGHACCWSWGELHVSSTRGGKVS